jgi:purine nucleosidase
MKKIPLIMDCDPGLDDAIALLLALASPEEIDLLGVTTVIGNASAEQTQENARRICELAGRLDVKVFKGCPRSFFMKSFMTHTTYTGADIHGDTGLGGCNLPRPTMPLQSQHAVHFIIETLLKAEEKVTIAPTGALTNIACALIMEPRIKEKIEKFIVMGGSIGLGNITPSAEYNFYTDPQAAYALFMSGIPIVMIGLDTTRQTQISEEWLKTIKTLNTPVSEAIIDMLSYYARPGAILEPGVSSGVLHDPNVIAYLLNPTLYEGREAHVEIDVSSTIMTGRSIVDWYGKRQYKSNAMAINQVDSDGFFNLLTERLKRYGNTTCNHN